MSFVTAPSPGQRITIFSRCQARHVHVLILPRDAEQDDSGQHLHLLYEIASGTDAISLKERPVPVGAGDTAAMIAVEFDGGSHRLNYGGTLSLVGGRGVYEVRVYEGDAGKRVPHWHYLSTRTPNSVYLMPDHHTMIGALVATPATIGGVSVSLDHTPIPITSNVEFSGRMNPIFTGWWG